MQKLTLSSFFVFMLCVNINLSLFSQPSVDSINNLPKEERAKAFLKITKTYYSSNYDLADEYSNMALELANELNQEYEEGMAYKYLGITNYFRHEFEKSHGYYNQALFLFEKTEDLQEQSNVLNNIAILYSESDAFDKSIVYNKKALKLREEINDEKGCAMSYANIGNLYVANNEHTKALEYYMKALKLNEESSISKPNPILFSSVASCYAQMGNVSTALDFYLRADSAAEELGNIRSIIITKTNYGLYCEHTGSLKKAITIFSEALALAEENNMEYSKSILMFNLGNFYTYSEQFAKAADFYSSALPVYKEINDTVGQIKCYINVGIANSGQNLNDTALSKFIQAQKLAVQYGRPVLIAMTANFLGKQYLDLDNFTDSKYWFKNALEIALQNNLTNELYNAKLNLGWYWHQLKKYDIAIIYFEESDRIAKLIGNVIFLKESNYALWGCYEKLGKYQNALEAFKEYDVFKDSIYDEEKQEQIRNIEGKLNMQMKENQIVHQTQIISQQKKILKQEKRNKIYVIVVAILVIGLLIIIYSREQMRRQKERAILVYEKKLLNTEMEKKELRKKELETELEYKSRQMTTHTLNMMQKNKALREMTVDITNISKKADSSIKQDLKRLKFMLNQSLKVDKDWDEFRLYFEQVNQTFFSKLKEISPNISPAEERLAALIKLKMNIKETASVLNISPSSVKMARHRLRQKLNLPQDVDLYDFIGDVG